jgi:hypothetical protein
MKPLRSLASLGFFGALALGSSCMYNTTPPASQTPVQTLYTPGYTVATIPTTHTVVTRGGTRYYVVDGIYYRASPNGYVVVPRPL